MKASAIANNLEETCSFLSERLRKGTHEFIQYRELVHSKGAGKLPRVVSIPSSRDRIALKAMGKFLSDVFPKSVADIPQVPVRHISAELRGGAYDSFVKIDIVNFYPSISHHDVRRALQLKLRRQSILDLFVRAISNPTVPRGEPSRRSETRGVPQGLAISNNLAELVMGPVDRSIKERGDCSYYRYVDDILILCHGEQVDELDALVRAQLDRYNLSAHPRSGDGGGKSRVGRIEHGFTYLGYNFSRDCISVRRSSVHKLEARVAKELTKYKRAPRNRKRQALVACQWRVNLAITGFVFDGRGFGWLPFFRQLDDLKLLKELDSTFHKLLRRFGLSDRMRIKSISRAYWAISYPDADNGKYIPNFDGLSVSQQRDQLQRALGSAEVEDLEDDEVPALFRRTIMKIAAEYEQDIGDLS